MEYAPTRSHTEISPFKRLRLDAAEQSTSFDRKSTNMTKLTSIDELPRGFMHNLTFVSLEIFFRIVFELIEFGFFFKKIKTQASNEKYEQCIHTLITYNDTRNYETYRNSLFSIFKEKKWTYILNGMVQYTQAAHKDTFVRDIKDFDEKRS